MDRRIGGDVREFGISGLLYKSNVLLYDRQSKPSQESLWSQIEMRAVAGPAARKKLEMELVPFQQVSWSAWKEKHPSTKVLSTETGHNRNYARNPYSQYFSTNRLMFPVEKRRDDEPDLKNKDMVLVVEVDGTFKAYPYKRVAKAVGSDGTLVDQVSGTKIRLNYDAEDENVSAYYENREGQPPVSYMFWFAFQSAFDEAKLYSPSK